MQILWEYENGKIAYRVTQLSDEYTDPEMVLWYRFKDKTVWGKWQRVTSFEPSCEDCPVPDPEVMECKEKDCIKCLEAKCTCEIQYEMMQILIQQAAAYTMLSSVVKEKRNRKASTLNKPEPPTAA